MKVHLERNRHWYSLGMLAGLAFLAGLMVLGTAEPAAAGLGGYTSFTYYGETGFACNFSDLVGGKTPICNAAGKVIGHHTWGVTTACVRTQPSHCLQ